MRVSIQRGAFPASVREMLEARQHGHRQHAAGGDHREGQPALPADVGLGEYDGHQGHQHHHRQQVRATNVMTKSGDPVADADQRDRLSDICRRRPAPARPPARRIAPAPIAAMARNQADRSTHRYSNSGSTHAGAAHRARWPVRKS